MNTVHRSRVGLEEAARDQRRQAGGGAPEFPRCDGAREGGASQAPPGREGEVSYRVFSESPTQLGLPSSLFFDFAFAQTLFLSVWLPKREPVWNRPPSLFRSRLFADQCT